MYACHQKLKDTHKKIFYWARCWVCRQIFAICLLQMAQCSLGWYCLHAGVKGSITMAMIKVIMTVNHRYFFILSRCHWKVIMSTSTEPACVSRTATFPSIPNSTCRSSDNISTSLDLINIKHSLRTKFDHHKCQTNVCYPSHILLCDQMESTLNLLCREFNMVSISHYPHLVNQQAWLSPTPTN